MPYNEEFFSAYRVYLEEETVRRAHSTAFRTFMSHYMANSPNLLPAVIDLGCGQAQEFRNYADWDIYIGVDLDVGAEERFLLNADYRDPGFTKAIAEHELFEEVDTFVSLFSAECTASFQENTELYERVFREIPQVKFGLVAGFYYPSKKHKGKVGETGGIESWQTLERIERGLSEVFDEFRLVIPCPSQMFGEEVIEVWRILTAKDPPTQDVPDQE